MTIVDERGRLFGRFNLIDAAVVLVVLVLVPLAYAAYRVFRPAAVIIESLEPSRVVVGQKPRIHLHGQHLLPYLRAQVGGAQPHVFLIESPSDGEFDLPELPPGTYDLTLYDEVKLVARMRNAMTVTAPPAGPRVRLRLEGAFFGLDESRAREIVAGHTFPGEPGSAIEVVEAGAPREDVRRVRSVVGSETIISVPVPGSLLVPATLRAACTPGGEQQNCAVNGTTVSPGVTIPVAGGFSFVVDDVRADAPPSRMTVRVEFVGRPEVIDLMAAGDVDVSSGGSGRIVSIANRQTLTGQVSRQVGSAGITETATTSERLASVDATLALTADRASTGLMYRSTPLKPGALFSFETLKYAAHGAVVSVAPAPAGGATK
jgi:hypothetical protein